MSAIILERALFVVGHRHTGKSKQLRSMLLDKKMGVDGVIRENTNIPKSFGLCFDCRLLLILSSPHELGLTPKKYVDKLKTRMSAGRWCFAGALHPEPYENMPGLVETIKYFNAEFHPERIRVCFLSPDRNGKWLHDKMKIDAILKDLKKIGGVEYLFIDARSKAANGLLLFDFFDFHA